MTRKEKELKALEAFDLKVGDRIRCTEELTSPFYKIIENEFSISAINEETGVQYNAIHFITFYDWTKVGPSLKNKKCRDTDCDVCPFTFNKDYLSCARYGAFSDETLEEIYKKIKSDLDEAKKELDGEE